MYMNMYVVLVYTYCMYASIYKGTGWCQREGRRCFLFASIYGGRDRLMPERGRLCFYLSKYWRKGLVDAGGWGKTVYIFSLIEHDCKSLHLYNNCDIWWVICLSLSVIRVCDDIRYILYSFVEKGDCEWYTCVIYV